MKYFILAVALFTLNGCATMIHKGSDSQYEASRVSTARIYGSEMILTDDMCAKLEPVTDEANPAKYVQCLPLISFEKGNSSEQAAAKMALRYKFGNVEMAKLECTAKNTCASRASFELELMVTHNRELRRLLMEQSKKDNAEYVKSHNAESASWREAWSSPPTTHCTSTVNGNIVNTRCR